MSALVLGIVAVSAGLVSALLERSRPRLALGLGLTGAALALAIAAGMRPGDGLTVGGTLIAGSGGLRAVGLAWAGGIVLLGLLGGVVGGPGGIVGPSLLGLGTAALALGNADPVIALLLLTAGGVVSVIGAALGSPARPRIRGLVASEVARRALQAIVLAGGLSYLAFAWGASPVGPLGAVDPLGEVDPAFASSAGIILLAVAAAVALRSSAIPAHLWGARLAGTASPGALPATLAWGSAAFAITALGWLQVTLVPVPVALEAERSIVIVIAVLGIVFGGAAALFHDDIAHVLGYSLVQDVGIVLLAFASIDAASAVAAREWILGMAAVKTAFAAWILAAAAGFGTDRRAGLDGWLRRRPVLGLGFVAIAVGAIGVPGMATFAARGTLVAGALDGPIGTLVLLAAFAPLAYLGRILVVGFARPTGAVAAADGDRPDAVALGTRGWSGRRPSDVLLAGRRIYDANRAPIASAIVLATALLGLAVAASGPGSVAFGPAEGGPGPGAIESPEPSLPG